MSSDFLTTYLGWALIVLAVFVIFSGVIIHLAVSKQLKKELRESEKRCDKIIGTMNIPPEMKGKTFGE
jgi:hypothetical protein